MALYPDNKTRYVYQCTECGFQIPNFQGVFCLFRNANTVRKLLKYRTARNVAPSHSQSNRTDGAGARRVTEQGCGCV